MEQIQFSLPVSFIKEGERVVAYTPALDLATSGKDEAEAKERFGEIVRMFFADLVENKTTDTVLSDLGWRRMDNAWQPPVVSQQSLNVEVPAFA